MHKSVALIFVFTLLVSALFAQQENPPKGSMPPKMLVRGRLINPTNQAPVEYATVVLLSKKDSTLLNGTISSTDGKFEISSQQTDVFIKINCIGYELMILSDLGVSPVVDLGVLQMKPSSQQLKGVEIRAEQSEMVFKMDKRVFNVGQDLVNSGGSALDVLNNVPSVDVNIQGTVSLRGNANVQVLINGKPSVIADGNSLGSITADMIERVEVVTNPSAKHDAEGTSGIINIILKKEDKKGTNGAVTVNLGYPQNYSLGFSLNHRTEKFNLFTQMGVGKRKLIKRSEGKTIDYQSLTQSTLLSSSEGEKNELFTNLILGADYHINANNMLTLTGRFAYEWEDEFTDIDYRFLDDGIDTRANLRKELSESTNPKWEFDLSYIKTFTNNKDHQLSMSANGSFFGKTKSLNYQNIYSIPTVYTDNEKATSVFSEPRYVFRADYTNPISQNGILEAGVKTNINNVTSDYDYFNLNNGVWENNINYTNAMIFRQRVSAVYLTYAHEWDKIGIKAGLRGEHTYQLLDAQTESDDVTQNYTQLFPSFHTSYEFSKGNFLQLGYSRRIQRPHMHQLNSFISYTDQYNLRMGNGKLLPEYSHAMELTVGRIRKKYSLNGSVYYRHTTNVISDIVYLKDSVSINTFQNIGKSHNTGIELNFKYSPSKWLSFMGDGNVLFYNRTGHFQNSDFDFHSTMGMARLTAKVKVLKTIDAEIRARYRSKYKDVMRTNLANASMDLGLKKKFGKGRSVLHLSVRDVFNSSYHEYVMDTQEFYRYSMMQWGGRQIVLGFSYSFGKGEAMEFSGQKMF